MIATSCVEEMRHRIVQQSVRNTRLARGSYINQTYKAAARRFEATAGEVYARRNAYGEFGLLHNQRRRRPLRTVKAIRAPKLIISERIERDMCRQVADIVALFWQHRRS